MSSLGVYRSLHSDFSNAMSKKKNCRVAQKSELEQRKFFASSARTPFPILLKSSLVLWGCVRPERRFFSGGNKDAEQGKFLLRHSDPTFHHRALADCSGFVCSTSICATFFFFVVHTLIPQRGEAFRGFDEPAQASVREARHVENKIHLFPHSLSYN